MGLLDHIEDEVGPISDAERALAYRELDLLAESSARIAGRLPASATAEEQYQALTELLHEDRELAIVFLELVDVSRSNRASPMGSIQRLEQQQPRSKMDAQPR